MTVTPWSCPVNQAELARMAHAPCRLPAVSLAASIVGRDPAMRAQLVAHSQRPGMPDQTWGNGGNLKNRYQTTKGGHA